MASESRWRTESNRVIHRALESGRELGLIGIALERHVSAAYPFGQRSMAPYRVWLSEFARLVRGDKTKADRRRSPTPLLGSWPMTEAQRNALEAPTTHVPIRAHRMADGRYWLESRRYGKTDIGKLKAVLHYATQSGDAERDRLNKRWIVNEPMVDEIHAARMYGCIIEGYCHQGRPAYAEADQVEVDRLAIREIVCLGCNRNQNVWSVRIVDVMGEVDVARHVYEVDFKSMVEG